MSARLVTGKLKVAPSAFARLLNGQSRVTPEMALRLSKTLGRSPESWLAMQNNYDLWQARRHLNVDEIERLEGVKEGGTLTAGESDFSLAEPKTTTAGQGNAPVHIDDATLAAFQARAEEAGIGYQQLINETLQAYLGEGMEKPLTESTLRRVLREELPKYQTGGE